MKRIDQQKVFCCDWSLFVTLKCLSSLEIVTKLEQQIKNEEDSIENLKKEEKKSLKVSK